MRKSSWFVLALVLGLNFVLWAAANRPRSLPAWTEPVQGFSFSPYRAHHDPYAERYPAPADIDADLALVADKTRAVRTYSSANGLEEIPALARRHGLLVTAGAWLDRRQASNEKEIANLIANADRHQHISRLVVGNEAILRGDLTVAEMTAHLRRVRQATDKPVSTAEPWHVWIKYPALAKEADYILIHVLPYWEGVPIDQAVDWVFTRYQQVQAAFPGKPVVIGEVGWPSDGHRFGKARAGLVNQARFIREFLPRAEAAGLDYFLMEAFDQPWKKKEEGVVGRHWGMFDSNRQAKFSLTEAVTEVALWPWQATLAALLALTPLLFFLPRATTLRRRGRLFFAILVQAAAALLSWTLFLPLTRDLAPLGLVVWAGLVPAQLLLAAVVLSNGFEFAELRWAKVRRRFFPALKAASGRADLPKVSIHLAIHNEPPEMVRQTLDSLARLDYPAFEVLVVDNNTADEAVWRPVEAHCSGLGEHFRFFHLAPWPGFKAGALNFALAHTAPDAEVIGVIDSDYLVEPDWLRSLAPYFDRPRVGFVQAPQDNRQWQGNVFKTMINWEYQGFFQLGMVQRNERDAIIQHGTMTLIRRAALSAVGGWSEWCICEDAELGLRLLAARYESVYVNQVFGRGLTPDTFAGYKGQRLRWVFGAAQIVRRHWRTLLGLGAHEASASAPRLTPGQRYHFLAGWLPWLADGLHFAFAATGIFWTVGLLLWPKYFEFPLAAFMVPLLAVFVGKMLHAILLYKARVACGFWERLGAAVAGMGLTHTISRAVLAGVCGADKPFFRTPKNENSPALWHGLLMAGEELQLCGLLWLAALAVVWRYGLDNPEAALWSAVLVVQSLPYAAAVVTALINARPRFSLGRLPLLLPAMSRKLSRSLTSFLW